MAKPVLTPPPDPTPAPPPDEVVTEPEIEGAPGTLPDGVSMHDAGKLPNTTNRADLIAPDPTQPPPGWKGSFARCGGCGDFIGNADRCPKCAPPMPATNYNHGV